MELIIVLVSALAAARLFRVLTQDVISESFRQKVVTRFNDTWLKFWFCPWCFGFWICVAFVLTGIVTGPCLLWWVIAGSLAANYMSAHLAARLD